MLSDLAWTVRFLLRFPQLLAPQLCLNGSVDWSRTINLPADLTRQTKRTVRRSVPCARQSKGRTDRDLGCDFSWVDPVDARQLAGERQVKLLLVQRALPPRYHHGCDRIADEIERAESIRPPVGTLDITLYRDDLTTIGPRPVLGETRLPTGGIDERPLVIIDDVCYTGRTVRAALDELADFGRPAR